MNTATNVVEINVQNFQTEVVEKSNQLPIFLEFYAAGAEASDQLAPILARLATEYQGKFVLARVNIQENQQIVQQLQVRTLPTIKVIFQGQMAQNLEGPQDEATLRDLLEQLTMSPIERIREQIDFLLSQGDRTGAIAMLREAISQEPANHAMSVELADLLVMEDQIIEAQQLLAGLPQDTDGISKPRNRIEFIELSQTLPDLTSLRENYTSTPEDLTLAYQLAVRLIADDQIEDALNVLLDSLKRDKSFDEELARRTMIKVFELLGKGDALATAYRRKMFTFLH